MPMPHSQSWTRRDPSKFDKTTFGQKPHPKHHVTRSARSEAADYASNKTPPQALFPRTGTPDRLFHRSIAIYGFLL